MSRRIYVACLASYNAGVLHGRWIDATDDAYTMRETVAAMLRESPFPNVTVPHPETGEMVASAEEWAIHDHEGLGDLISEYTSFDTIAAIVGYLDATEDGGIPEGAAIAFLENDTYRLETPDRIADAADDARDAYAGQHDNLEAFAEGLADDAGDLKDVPERYRPYIDFAAMGRDLELGGDVWTTRVDGDLHVFWNR